MSVDEFHDVVLVIGLMPISGHFLSASSPVTWAILLFVLSMWTSPHDFRTRIKDGGMMFRVGKGLGL